MRRWLAGLGVLAALSCSHARADEDPDLYAPALQTCIEAAAADADRLAACKGASAEPCISADGGTTHGMVMCFSNEAEVWARAMEESQRRLTVASPETAAALADSQRAWASYRDAQCGYRVALWGEGSGARVELAACIAAMTADRAILLSAASP